MAPHDIYYSWGTCATVFRSQTKTKTTRSCFSIWARGRRTGIPDVGSGGDSGESSALRASLVDRTSYEEKEPWKERKKGISPRTRSRSPL